MTSTITAYRDGRFTTEPTPDWWDTEVDRLYPEHGRPNFDFGFGEEFGCRIEVMTLTEGRGRLVDMSTGDGTMFVWARTQADLLDLLTTRAGPFIGLAGEERTITASLDAIANTLIGFARHGQGEHVHAHGGRNDIDTRRHRDAVQASRRAAQSAA